MATHETQDRTLLTVILIFTILFFLLFFSFSELHSKKMLNSAGALANFSVCSAVHLPYAKEKASIFGTHLCTWAVVALHFDSGTEDMHVLQRDVMSTKA